jgi:hypothetical protein
VIGISTPVKLTFAKHGYAVRAQSRIAGGLLIPREPKAEAAQPTEGSRAQLAAWRGRDSSEHPPLPNQTRTLPGEHGADSFRCRSLGRHLVNLHTHEPGRFSPFDVDLSAG